MLHAVRIMRSWREVKENDRMKLGAVSRMSIVCTFHGPTNSSTDRDGTNESEVRTQAHTFK